MRRLSVYAVPEIPEGKIDRFCRDFPGREFLKIGSRNTGATKVLSRYMTQTLGRPLSIINAKYGTMLNS
jgi:hypothetical protein